MAVTNEQILEAIRNQQQTVAEIRQLLREQNGRVRKLENWKSWITGGLALACFVLPAAVAVLIKFI